MLENIFSETGFKMKVALRLVNNLSNLFEVEQAPANTFSPPDTSTEKSGKMLSLNVLENDPHKNNRICTFFIT